MNSAAFVFLENFLFLHCFWAGMSKIKWQVNYEGLNY